MSLLRNNQVDDQCLYYETINVMTNVIITRHGSHSDMVGNKMSVKTPSYLFP